jgi:hypothetical protein
MCSEYVVFYAEKLADPIDILFGYNGIAGSTFA